jgi:hypothetical protein
MEPDGECFGLLIWQNIDHGALDSSQQAAGIIMTGRLLMKDL